MGIRLRAQSFDAVCLGEACSSQPSALTPS